MVVVGDISHAWNGRIRMQKQKQKQSMVRGERAQACVPHADGRRDGVADGDAHQVDVLRQRAQPVLGHP